jgi:cyclase
MIASGGAGEPQHFVDVFEKTNVDGALAASIFHKNEYSIDRVKYELKSNNINVRI